MEQVFFSLNECHCPPPERPPQKKLRVTPVGTDAPDAAPMKSTSPKRRVLIQCVGATSPPSRPPLPRLGAPWGWPCPGGDFVGGDESGELWATSGSPRRSRPDPTPDFATRRRRNPCCVWSGVGASGASVAIEFFLGGPSGVVTLVNTLKLLEMNRRNRCR